MIVASLKQRQSPNSASELSTVHDPPYGQYPLPKIPYMEGHELILAIMWITAATEWHENLKADVPKYENESETLQRSQRHHRMFQERPECLRAETLRKFCECSFPVKTISPVISRIDRRLAEYQAKHPLKKKASTSSSSSWSGSERMSWNFREFILILHVASYITPQA